MVPGDWLYYCDGGGYVHPNLPAVVESRCCAEENFVCIIHIGLYYLFIILFYFSAHPIELEGVHILTKAHGRAPV